MIKNYLSGGEKIVTCGIQVKNFHAEPPIGFRILRISATARPMNGSTASLAISFMQSFGDALIHINISPRLSRRKAVSRVRGCNA